MVNTRAGRQRPRENGERVRRVFALGGAHTRTAYTASLEEADSFLEKAAAAGPDLLMVCLGSPKQELWMSAHAGRLNAGLMAGLGGSLDVFAGRVERAPEAWRRLGLEWLYRVIKEPKRLGRVMKLPLFVVEAAGQRAKGKREHGKQR